MRGLIGLFSGIVLLASCGGPKQSELMRELSDQHSMMYTHVISRSMLDAMTGLIDKAGSSVETDEATGSLLALVENLEKVVVFNKDDLNRIAEDSMANYLRNELDAMGSELLIETSIQGGDVGLYVVESGGVASRTHILIRSPYNEDGGRSWSSGEPVFEELRSEFADQVHPEAPSINIDSLSVQDQEAIQQALIATGQVREVEGEVNQLASLFNIDSGLTLIECTGSMDLKALSGAVMQLSNNSFLP